MSGRFAGKVAVVTGGARGMGEATVRLFAQEGAKVVIADVLEAEGAALAAELGDAARFYRHDVTSEAAWAEVVGQIEADLGPVDVLVCNAASNPYYGPQAGISDEQFRKVLDNNIVSNHWLIGMVAPGMVARKGGSICLATPVIPFP